MRYQSHLEWLTKVKGKITGNQINSKIQNNNFGFDKMELFIINRVLNIVWKIKRLLKNLDSISLLAPINVTKLALAGFNQNVIKTVNHFVLTYNCFLIIKIKIGRV